MPKKTELSIQKKEECERHQKKLQELMFVKSSNLPIPLRKIASGKQTLKKYGQLRAKEILRENPTPKKLALRLAECELALSHTKLGVDQCMKLWIECTGHIKKMKELVSSGPKKGAKQGGAKNNEKVKADKLIVEEAAQRLIRSGKKISHEDLHNEANTLGVEQRKTGDPEKDHVSGNSVKNYISKNRKKRR